MIFPDSPQRHFYRNQLSLEGDCILSESSYPVTFFQVTRYNGERVLDFDRHSKVWNPNSAGIIE